jgi:hypothetical protein
LSLQQSLFAPHVCAVGRQQSLVVVLQVTPSDCSQQSESLVQAVPKLTQQVCWTASHRPLQHGIPASAQGCATAMHVPPASPPEPDAPAVPPVPVAVAVAVPLELAWLPLLAPPWPGPRT